MQLLSKMNSSQSANVVRDQGEDWDVLGSAAASGDHNVHIICRFLDLGQFSFLLETLLLTEKLIFLWVDRAQGIRWHLDKVPIWAKENVSECESI